MSSHPILVVVAAAVAAPLLAEIPKRMRVPVVVLEVVLGIVIGPQVLGLVQFKSVAGASEAMALATSFMVTMRIIGTGAVLFMAGMEVDLGCVRGRPLSLAVRGWTLSLALAFAAAGLLHTTPLVHAPIMLGLALTTTSLGALFPVLRDAGQLETPFGRLFLAAGTVGEVGPIVGMSLFLSQQVSTWQQAGYLLAFVGIVILAAGAGISARPPAIVGLFSRSLHSSTQLPVRVAVLLLGVFLVLAIDLGFEAILGAFAAGMVVGLATRGEESKPFREKLDALFFGFLTPFFFIGTGSTFDLASLTGDLPTMLLVPAFLVLLLVVRGAPVFLYRNDLAREERLPFALFTSVPSLGLTIVLTEVGLRAGNMNPDVAAALVGAALLSLLLFPTIAGRVGTTAGGTAI